MKLCLNVSLKSMKLVAIPAVGTKNAKINLDAIDSKSPLLLSRKEIMAKARIEFDNDVINIWLRY